MDTQGSLSGHRFWTCHGCRCCRYVRMPMSLYAVERAHTLRRQGLSSRPRTRTTTSSRSASSSCPCGAGNATRTLLRARKSHKLSRTVTPFEQTPSFTVCGGSKMTEFGAFAQYIVVERDQVIQTPDHIDDVHAAAWPLGGVTAWRCVFLALTLRPTSTQTTYVGISAGLPL